MFYPQNGDRIVAIRFCDFTLCIGMSAVTAHSALTCSNREIADIAACLRVAYLTQGYSGAGTRGGRRPPFFSTGGTRPPLLPLFWTETRAKVSPLLQLVTY